MKAGILKALTTFLIIGMSQNVFAAGDQTTYKPDSWLMKMIYQPSPSLLRREARGFVNIYDGFTDTQVDEILDRQFERIGHMMFTRMKMTSATGEVLKDPVTGNDLVADDGCD